MKTMNVRVIIGRTSAGATVDVTDEQAAWLRSHELFLWRESYRGHPGIKTPVGFVRGKINQVNPIVGILAALPTS
jgi:hypothetical protein